MIVTEAMVFSFLAKITVIWFSMCMIDGWFNITVKGVNHWYRSLGVILMGISFFGWIFFALYKLWML